MKPTSILPLMAAATFAASSVHSQAAVFAGGPDAWARGNVANDGSFASVYYAWDTFDAGSPGPFGNSTLDDSSPEIGVDPGGANASQGDQAAYGLRSTTGNLYSGFQGDALNLDLTLANNGTASSGSTTVFLTLIGNPAGDRELLPFTLSDGVNSFSPDAVVDGLSPDLVLGDGSLQRVWVAEWHLAGNANSYTVGIISDLASGNGTDVAIDSLSIDIAWTSTQAALANSQGPDSLGGITLIPEPSGGLLTLAALATLCLSRSRRAL